MAKDSIQKELEKEVERQRQEAIQNSLHDEDETEYAKNDNDFTHASPQDRLKMIVKGDVGNRKKKEEKKSITEQNELDMESPLPRTLASDYIPIESIDDGIIKMEDGRYVAIVEILPVNFLLKSPSEQNAIVYGFERYIRIAPNHIQFLSISKKTDLSAFVKKIDEEMEKETNEKCRELQQDYKDLLTGVESREAVSRRFFGILDYKPNASDSSDITEIKRQMHSLKTQLINGLKTCGNQCLVWDNDTNETAKILFEILNREIHPSEFPYHISKVANWYKDTYGEDGADNIHVTEFFAPEKINFKNHDYTKINNVYYDFMFIKSNGYPTSIPAGWTSIFVNAGEGIDVKFDFKKEDKTRTLSRIGKRLRISSSRAQNLNASTTEYDDLEDTAMSGFYLKNGLSRGNEDFYYMTILLTITADSIDELDWKRRELEQYLRASEIFLQNCNYIQSEALLSYLPLGYMSKDISKRAKRNILTSDLAALYPFTSYELSDEDGVLLGVNELNNSLVITDFFNSERYMNANISILGTSGAGKTYTTQLLTTRLRRKGIQVFVIAPYKGYEFKRACENIGGEFIKISPSSKQCINAMEIRMTDDDATKYLEGEENLSKLAEKIESLHIFFELLIPDMNAEEEQLLDEALLNVYNRYGITHDNDSLYDPKDKTKYREMPILGDLYEELLKDERSVRMANIMNRLVNGSASSFNQRTNVDLNNLYTVIDISALDGSPLLPVGMYLAIDYVFSKSKENRTKRKAIVIDETWKLISCNAKAAEYVLTIFKIIRGYGGSAICATQDLNDFLSFENGKYGKGIINNSKTKIVLKLEDKEAKSVKELLDLSEEEYQKIVKFNRGHGLLSTNKNNVPIHFKASELENIMITTDRQELERYVEERKRNELTT